MGLGLALLLSTFLLLTAVQNAKAQTPSLSGFQLNMTPPEQLLLTFSEAVSDNCNASFAVIMDTNIQPPNFVVPLEGTCVYNNAAMTVLLVNLNPIVWELIQGETNLATSTSNTYISMQSGFVSSLLGIPNTVGILQVNQFTSNTNPPTLQGCVIDQPSRILGLMFSEGVILSSLVPTFVTITFLNIATSMNQTYMLTGGTPMAFGQGTSNVGIVLSDADFAVLFTGSSNPSDYSVTLAANAARDGNGMFNVLQTNVPVINVMIEAPLPPEIISFSLDFTAMSVDISFSVTSQNIVFDQLYFTNQSLPFVESNSYSLVGSSVSAQPDLVTVMIMLNTTTVNAILADPNICTDISNCFLFWRNFTFTDLNGSPTVEPPQAIQAQGVTFQIDTTPPVLMQFSIDLLNGNISLTFSEPVFADVFDVAALTLTNRNTRQQSVSGAIDLDTVPMDGLSSTVTILLAEESLNFAKGLQTPFLAIYENATTDSSGNQVVPITTSNPLSPTTVIQDTTPPEPISFAPNSGNRQLIIMFDEAVNPNSWSEALLTLTLQVQAGDFTYSNFTGGSVTGGPPQNLTYTISTSMFVAPFSDRFLEASSMGALVLTARPGLVADLSGNSLNVMTQLVFTLLPPDTTPPTLNSFMLDMNLGTLQMTFSEAVYLSPAVGLVQFYNQGSFNATDLVTYTLVENGTYSGLQNGPVISITLILGVLDLNSIKASRSLCTSRSNTFLGVFTQLAQDRGGNILQSGSSPIQASAYVADTIPPMVSSFTLDLNNGIVSIQFSEPVDESTLMLSGIFLNPAMNSQSGVSLSGNVNVQFLDSSTTVAVSLDAITLNSIKANVQFCTQISNCYLTLNSLSFRDTSDNVRNTMTTIQVAQLIIDSTRPRLLSYNVDLNNGGLTLTFDEPINMNSFNPTSFNFTTISSSPLFITSPAMDATLQGTSTFNTILNVQLGMSSLNQLKIIAASNSSNVGASIEESFILDTVGNFIVPIPSSSPLAPQTIVADTQQPQLIQFRPQFPTAMDITFYFDELVQSSSFNPNAFSLSLTTLQGTFEYSGFSGTTTSSPVGTILTATFSSGEFNATFSEQFMEASQRGSISLTATSSFITDIFNNPLFPITNSNPLVYSTDTQRPMLLNYTLDLDVGLLDLFFTEPVNINPVPSLIQIQNSAVSPSANLTLTGFSSIVPGDVASEAKMIYLTADDRTALSSNQLLATSRTNTFLALEAEFASDLSGNTLSPNATAVQASVVVQDTTGPYISVSRLNLNDGVLVLEFSEPILLLSLVLSRIYITGMIQSSPIGYNLAGGATTGENIASSVTIQLANRTLNAIKSDLQVCPSSESCFIFVSAGAFQDVSGNGASASSRNITSLFEDIVQPTLTSFSLDLNAGTMVFTFSEPIITSSLDLSQITLLLPDASQSRSLQGATIVGFQSSNMVASVSLTSSILNRVKVFAAAGSVVLAMTSMAATDTSNLMVEAIPPVSAQRPSPFIPDTTPPTVLRFIPSSGGQLTFTFVFDEFVSASSLASSTSMLSFQLRGRNGQFTYADLSSAMIRDLSDRIVLTFPPSETRFSLTNTAFQDAYLSSYSDGSITFNVVQFFIRDISGNGYIGPLSFTFTNSSDTLRPRLTNYTLDLNTGEMTLTFNEDVNVLTVVGNARFGNSPSSPSVIYSIQQEPRISTVNSQPVSTIVFVSLNLSDVDNIVANPSIGRSTSDTYLYLQEMFAVDSSGNYLDVSGNAVQAGQIIPRVVIIQPQLTSFDLFSLDNGSMVLSFNVPVDASSLTITEVTLFSEQSRSSPSLLTYTLTGGQVVYANDNQTSLRITLTSDDVRTIKSLSDLASNTNNTFVGITDLALVDSQGATVIATDVPIQLSGGRFIPDTTGPTLLQYAFDLNASQIILTFSDIIVASRFNSEYITLQNARSSPSATLQLTRSIINQQDSPIILVQLSSDDYNQILSNLNLATSASSTFISFTSQLAVDSDGNNVFEIPSTNALPPVIYVPDGVSPSLSLFTLDMNSGLILLTFSEPILMNSLRQSELVLQNAVVPSTNFSLVNQTIQQSSTMVSSFLSIRLDEDSLNLLKSLDGFTSRDDSFILVSTSLATDTNGNSFGQGIVQASSFLPDVRRPTLIDFDLDVKQNNAMYLYFSEAITYSGNPVTSITLLNNQTSPTIVRPLTSTNTAIRQSLTGIEVRINDRNLIGELLGRPPTLAASTMDLYMALSMDGFSDYAMNPVVGIPNVIAKRVRYIYRTCFPNFFNNISMGTCDQCSSVCEDYGCTGADSIAGDGGCNRCYSLILNNDNSQNQCRDENNPYPSYPYFEVQNSSYSGLASFVLQACNEACASCNGPLSTDCLSCNSYYVQTNDGRLAGCATSCTGSSNPSLCGPCHSQCLNCRGPSNQFCVACKESSILLNGVTTCIPECSNGTFLVRVPSTSNYECRSCDPLCLNCTGPNKEDCTQCRGPSDIVNGRLVCLESCPSNTYKAQNGSCQPCNKLCSGGCSGFTNRECVTCADLSIMISDTVTECTRSCPSNMVYDSVSDTCNFSTTTRIVIIVCCIVGGIILLVVLAVVLFCCFWCIRSRGKFQPEDSRKDVALLDKRENPYAFESYEARIPPQSRF